MLTVTATKAVMECSRVALDDAGNSVKMDQLLSQLRRSMVELILQGDDVTRQMWQMYSVFEEIFGRHTKPIPPSAFKPLVGDKLKIKTTETLLEPSKDNRSNEEKTTAHPPTPSVTGPPCANSSDSFESAAPEANLNPPNTVIPKTTSPETAPRASSADSTGDAIFPPVSDVEEKNALLAAQSDHGNGTSTACSDGTSYDITSDGSSSSVLPEAKKTQAGHQQTSQRPRISSNPLLETIGALTSNPDSDDSDLDVVYQQLRYRGRPHRAEMRIRNQRSQRHHHHHHHHHHQQQFANSDPESISYAGSNSIDSGYKSLCATPEVSDSLSAPEVRRSASDVSASDSSTTSGRPRSSDECCTENKSKIKMGTRAIAGKISSRNTRLPPAGQPMNDVSLDHLMYLRQSLRNDRSEYPSQVPKSSSSGLRKDVSLSSGALTDEEWLDPSQNRNRASRHRHHHHHNNLEQQFNEQSMSAAVSPCSSSISSPPYAGSATSHQDFLLSGAEYYDLESIDEFPQGSNYVTMMKGKTRSSQIPLLPAPKRNQADIFSRRVDPFYRKKTPAISGRSLSADLSTKYVPSRRGSREVPKVTTDSKLTEAAIRVLEMIEDFRLEEAMGSGGASCMEGSPYNRPPGTKKSVQYMPSLSPTSVGPHAFVPRFRKNPGASGSRPASTGSLIAHHLSADDASSIASSYAGSAEHHVYEEIMYDLICERPRESVVADIGKKARNRRLPVTPTSPVPHSYKTHSDPRASSYRGNPQRRSRNSFSVLPNLREHRSVERFLEMDWQSPKDRRDKLTPDFPL